MTMIFVGHRDAASTLAEGVENGAVWAADGESPSDSVAGIAAALLGFEAEIAERQVARVVLADASDAALAAALVGTKLPVEVVAVAAAREAPTANGRLIAQLAAAYTPPA